MLKRIAVVLMICSVVMFFAGVKSSTQAKYFRAKIEETREGIRKEKTAMEAKKKLAQKNPQEVQKIFEAFSDKIFQTGQFFGYNVNTKPQNKTGSGYSIISSIQDSSVPGIKKIELKSIITKKGKAEPLMMFTMLDLFKKFPVRIKSIDFSSGGSLNVVYGLYGT